MESITVILLVVVILAQIVLFALFFLERQSNNRRNKSILNYIDNTITEEVDRQKKQEEKNAETLNNLKLDYSQAQEAANKINDFSSSLANIFDYDPLKAIQKGRRTEAD